MANKFKKIATNVAVYGSLVMLGAVSGQQLGKFITGHSFVAHAGGQVNSQEAANTQPDQATNERPQGLGPCNCPLCCQG